MRNIYIIFIVCLLGSHSLIGQDLLNSYSGGSNSITPARIKYFENYTYIAANITISNQTFPCIIKLDNNGNIIWQTRLNQAGTVSDLDFVPQSSLSDKSILLVGASATSGSNLDNQSFIWKVKDDGTHLLSKFYSHLGNEGFTRIILHPNPVVSSHKYYIVGKRNVAFPVTTQNPANSYKTLLYNIDENLNVNWSQNFEITTGVASGNEAQFFNSIVPQSNGNIFLLGSSIKLSTNQVLYGGSLNLNPTNQNGTWYRSQFPREYNDGMISNGKMHIAGHLYDSSGGYIGANAGMSFSGSQKYIHNQSSHNGIVSSGNNIFTIGLKNGNPNGGKIMINKFEFTTLPFYNLNYLNSVAITPAGVNTSFNNPHLSQDATGNIIFTTSTNGVLYFGKINNSLNSSTAGSCYLGFPFVPTDGYDDGSNFQWKFNSEISTAVTTGQSVSITLSPTIICAPPCQLTVDFSFTNNCSIASFTPIVSGGTPPYTFQWNFDCTGSFESTLQNPVYDFNTLGNQCVNLTVTDATGQCMGTIQKSITLIDNVPPVVNCPSSITINTIPGFCYGLFSGISVMDNCDPQPSLTGQYFGASNGSFSGAATQIALNTGLTTISSSATDASGNVSTTNCITEVIVMDNEPPQIICPDDVEISGGDPCIGSANVIFGNPTTSDNCQVSSVFSSHQNGSTFACGTSTVTWNVKDNFGNTNSCSFNVTVNCDCINNAEMQLTCNKTSGLIDFEIEFNSNLGSICNVIAILDPTLGTIQNQMLSWVGNDGTISGVISPVSGSNLNYTIELASSCTCTNQNQINCNSSVLGVLTPCFKMFDKIYGDTSHNFASGIKAFGDGIYVSSKKRVNNLDFGVMTKFNRITGMLMWEKHFDIGSDEYFLGPINDFEYDSDDDALLVVGNKISGTVFSLNDYDSYLLKIDCSSGNIIFYNQYPFTGRTTFKKIIRHPNPVNPSYPYYIVGTKNPGLPSTMDRIFILNTDKDGAINFGREFNSSTSPPPFDDEFGRGLMPLKNGNLLLLGNDVPNGDGVILQVLGSNSIPVNGLLKGIGNIMEFDILDGIQINDTTLVIVGQRFDTKHGFISVYNLNIQTGAINHLNTTEFNDLNRFRSIHVDNNNRLYVIGQNITGLATQDHSVVFCFEMSPNRRILPVYSKFLHDINDTDFTEGFIDITSDTDIIYYVDSRLKSAGGFGQFDLLVGAYDLSLTNACQDTFINMITEIQLPTSNYNINSFALTVPNATHTINNLPLLYQCQDFCGPDCNLAVDIDVMKSGCFDYTFTAVVTGGSGPYNIQWDRDCDGGPYNSPNPSYSYTFPSFGTYCISVFVSDVNGCTATFEVEIEIIDNEKPELICPSDITLNTDINQYFASIGSLTATDNCDVNPVIYCTLTGATTGTFTVQDFSQIQFNKGTTTCDCYAEDDSGNISMPPCSFKVTVIDNQPPNIICPPSPAITVEFCEGGGTVTFSDPVVSDNCPMFGYSCSHQSGDFFACGSTVVNCVAQDMAGNTNSCSFNVNVACQCAEIASSSIECGQIPDTYDFVITLNNLSGNMSTCNISTAINASVASFAGTPRIDWFGTSATVTGTIIPVLPITSNFVLNINVQCTCPDGTMTTCNLPVTLVPPCCNEILLINSEVCKTTSDFNIAIDFEANPISISSVTWYFYSGSDCPLLPGDPRWQVYEITSVDNVNFYPPYLNDFCVYAVLNSNDFACKSLTSNVVQIKICETPVCTLNSQEFCYTGSSVTPSPILLNTNENCTYSITWYDQDGNIVPAAQDMLTFQPTPINWTLPNTECRQDFIYKAEISNICGVLTCESIITLFNGNAPIPPIIIDPTENLPVCPGEDLTLTFEPNCPKAPPQVTWTWLEGLSSTTLNPIISAGNINPQINTNMLFEDTWYGVEFKNGVCPADRSIIFIDVRDELDVFFTASPIGPCRNEGVLLEANFILNNCNGILKWYKNGEIIHTSVVSGTNDVFSYINPFLGGNYSGNYYVVLESTCCPNSLMSDVEHIDPPIILDVISPCFRCDQEPVMLEALLANDDGNCTFEWYKAVPGVGYVLIPGENGPILQLNEAGQFLCVAICGLCRVEKEVSFIQCNSGSPCTIGIENKGHLNYVKIYPNPTTDMIIIEFEKPVSGNLELYDVVGNLIFNLKLSPQDLKYFASLKIIPQGVYVLKILSPDVSLSPKIIIKI